MSTPSHSSPQTSTLVAAGGVAVASAALLWYRQSQDKPAPLPKFLQRLATSLYARAGGSGGKSHFSFPKVDAPVLYEKGANGQTSEERLYVQMQVLDAIDATKLPAARAKLQEELKGRDVSCVVYDDVNNARSIGLLTWSSDPAHFATVVNKVMQTPGIGDMLTPRVGWTMFGKTYANGHEPDLNDFLMKKVPRNACIPGSDFAVWYPMRRAGDFYMQSPEAQCRMLLHHAAIGRSYGESGAAHDIRLNCYGIDGQDNEFVVGLIGKDLFPLSKLVQEMRKTEHTSYYLKSLGPFFVGHRVFIHKSASN